LFPHPHFFDPPRAIKIRTPATNAKIPIATVPIKGRATSNIATNPVKIKKAAKKITPIIFKTFI
jgi:hypothetical protein